MLGRQLHGFACTMQQDTAKRLFADFPLEARARLSNEGKLVLLPLIIVHCSNILFVLELALIFFHVASIYN